MENERRGKGKGGVGYLKRRGGKNVLWVTTNSASLNETPTYERCKTA